MEAASIATERGYYYKADNNSDGLLAGTDTTPLFLKTT